MLQNYVRRPAILWLFMLGLLGCCCSCTPQKPLVDNGGFKVLAVNDREPTQVHIDDRDVVARFCGCEACIAKAKSLSPHERALLNFVVFNGPVEALLDFRQKVSWPTLLLVENDSNGRLIWKQNSPSLREVEAYAKR